MFHQESEEVKFNGASAYFSEEEWRLLQEWQKELYSTVMKEIHQALVSIGPLLVTTVCSLRAKDKGGLCPEESQDSNQKHATISSPSNMVTDHDVPFKIKKEENINVQNPKESGQKEGNEGRSSGFPPLDGDICFKKEKESGSIFIDHLGAEIEESEIDSSSGYEVVSFLINDDEEMPDVDTQDIKKAKCRRRPSGNGSMGVQKKMRGTIKHAKPGTHRKASALETNNKGGNGKSQIQPDGYQDTSQCENASTNSQHLISLQERPKGSIPQNDNAFEGNIKNSEFPNSLPSTQQNQTSYPCSKCDKTFGFKADLVRHRRQHKKGGPYTCTDCGKQFLQRGSIINHYRTHTGEKPFACILCLKSFNRKDYLDAHLRTHTGERPYKCTECEKSFTQKGELNQHRKKHTR